MARYRAFGTNAFGALEIGGENESSMTPQQYALQHAAELAEAAATKNIVMQNAVTRDINDRQARRAVERIANKLTKNEREQERKMMKRAGTTMRYKMMIAAIVAGIGLFIVYAVVLPTFGKNRNRVFFALVGVVAALFLYKGVESHREGEWTFAETGSYSY